MAGNPATRIILSWWLQEICDQVENEVAVVQSLTNQVISSTQQLQDGATVQPHHNKTKEKQDTSADQPVFNTEAGKGHTDEIKGEELKTDSKEADDAKNIKKGL